MKKSIIAAGVLALLASTGAKAADIVTYQEQPVAASSAVNWNGLYIGGTMGGSRAEGKTRLKEGGRKFVKKEVDPDSFIGGIYAGYNFQPGFLSNSFMKDVVFGLETDFLFNSGDSSSTKGFGDDVLSGKYRASVKQKWNGSTRLRAGYALGSEGRFLPYFAAGVSYADIQARSQLSQSFKDGDGNVNEKGRRYSQTKTRVGYNVGVGVDYVPPIMNDHLVLRAEYRFTDFGKESYNKGRYEIGSAATFKQRVKFQQNDFRVGVAYKF